MSIAYGQNQTLGPPDLGALQRLRLLEAGERPPLGQAPLGRVIAPPTKTWTLTPGVAKKSSGTFGLDLSYYETDDCRINWQTVAAVGVRYVYLEMTKGETSYPSVIHNWEQLESLHVSKTLFRGAYHFLLPNADLGTDATAQANKFLTTIGAVSGRKPVEFPPILDIEPTKTPITPGTAEFNNCTRRSSDGDHNYCDMWYKMNPQDIVKLALNWTTMVKRATGQDVMIYSSPGAWTQVVGTSGQPLVAGKAIWIARYSADGGPDKDPKWPSDTWNSTWNMPALFGGASYPSVTYNVPNFWQFSATARLSQSPFSCTGSPDPTGQLDFS